MGVQAVFVVLLMFVVTAQSKIGKVSFWGDTVTLTCPGEGTWLDTADKNKTDTRSIQFTGKAQYVCEYESEDSGTIKYLFYVKGKACKNCFEVDGLTFLLVILVDVIGTGILMRIIYVCTKKKQPNVPIQPPRARGPRQRADQSSAYEPLNPNTQATETYTTVVHKAR